MGIGLKVHYLPNYAAKHNHTISRAEMSSLQIDCYLLADE